MIKEKYLHYKTLRGFLNDLKVYGENSLYDKIVFILDKHVIWTHGQYYGNESYEDVINRILDKLNDLDAEKQDVLVSGENIKTINGESILGGGDISTPKYSILTKDEYDELETRKDDTLYLISE